MQSEEPQIHLKITSFRQRPLKNFDYKNPHNFLTLEEMCFGAKVNATLNNDPSFDQITLCRILY